MLSSPGQRSTVVFLAFFLIALLFGPTLGSLLANEARPITNYTQLVNPFIGTSASAPYGGGDTFPGAAYPLGMVQWSPDTISNPPGGYSFDDAKIKGLSLTHFSGRGCEVYQDFPFMPFVGNISYSPATHGSLYYSGFSHAGEVAHPGYYQVYLKDPDVTAELSVSAHTGVAQFTYPRSSFSTMIINAGGSINGNTNSSVTILASSNEVTGSAESTVGCGSSHYRVYFAARFDRPFSADGTWNGDTVVGGSTSSKGQQVGAFVVFDTRTNDLVLVQVGISFVSIANAESNLAAEFASFDLSSVAARADAAWNDRLSSIQVLGGTPAEQRTFYTALYHMFFHPNIFNDANGQYLGFDGLIHEVTPGHVQYENIPGWDQYRTMMALLSILAPTVASDVAQSLVNDARQGDGHLPRWEQANVDSHGMSGDDGDVMVAEAYAFGATNFDVHGALYAMVNGQPQVREGLASYVGLGYVPANLHSSLPSASITMEYAIDDFAIAQLARALGDSSDYTTFLQRSGSWQNVFNAFTGYIQPRNGDGSWVRNFNPSNQSGFQEGNSAQYSWMVPFNLHGLFDEMGGNSAVVSRLDTFFTKLNAGPSAPYAFLGNEPTVEVPWEYDFAQAPSHTQDVVRRIETQLFKNSPDGLPGNDDAGELSAWYIFATVGLYPEIPAVGGFVIGSPLFTSITINLTGGKVLHVGSPEASDAYPYVQSLRIDGIPTTSLWLPWGAASNGAMLSFSLGTSPTTWGSNPADAPPYYESQT